MKIQVMFHVNFTNVQHSINLFIVMVNRTE
jgi:hypothetical protein